MDFISTFRPALLIASLFGSLGTVGTASAKEMIDYFQPIPVTGPLTSNAWGEPAVRPRDISNGLESTSNSYFYWDGKVIKTADGKYHLHCSRWPKSGGFNQWASSIAVHAVSDNLLGPYVDKGPIYDRNGGKGHNVSSLALPDGSFAVYTSDVTPGDFYTASSIDGPWTFKGSIKIDTNGNDVDWPTANISAIVRPDNTFLATQRSGHIMVGGSSLLGTYVVQALVSRPNERLGYHRCRSSLPGSRCAVELESAADIPDVPPYS
jgi:hypothetical protein